MKMLLKIVIVVNIVVFAQSVTLPQSCGRFSENPGANWRIIHGTDAKKGEFPWHSLLDLVVEDKHNRDANNFCGGSIINDQWVLTAGHCFLWLKAKDVKVRLGVHTFTNEPDQNEVDIDVEKVFIQ